MSETTQTPAAPFDALAEAYDEQFTRTRLGRTLRTRVWERIDELLPASGRILDLGCGTGEDAARLSARGHEVLATDASTEMLEIARRKVGERGRPDRVRYRRLTLEAVAEGRLRNLEPFDLALANFGVLNGTDRWEELGYRLGELVRAGGKAILVVMGPYCPWEWGWYLARGRPAAAFRRLSGRTRSRLGADTELTVHYPSPRQLRAAFEDSFVHRRTEGLGVVLPPSYARRAAERSEDLLDVLDRWDRRVGKTRLGAWLGDHYLTILERSDPPRSISAPKPDSGLESILDRSASRAQIERREGIWHAVAPEGADELESFVEEYDAIRSAEGRGSEDSAYYRALPFEDRTGRHESDWRVRAQSYRTLVDRVVRPLEAGTDRPLRVLDLGAGNGWLSNRLAEQGHRPMAVDLRTDDRDGLGAIRHYETSFPAVRADFRELPFGSGTFDLVVFNASFHYAPDYELVLEEALRVLHRRGRVAVVDTPVYRDPESGRRMVREREEAFLEEHGFRSDTLESEEFLTRDRLGELAESTALSWTRHRPSRSWRRRLAPWTARVQGKREPARLPVIEGRPEDVPAERGIPRLREVVRDAERRLARAGWRLRRALVDFRERRRSTESVAGLTFLILPDVFNPVLFRTGRFLGEAVAADPPAPDERVLDLGCGSGVGAVVAARTTRSVIGVDVHRTAVRCARINARLNEVGDRVEIREGDLFEPVDDECFDLILFNPPFLSGEPRDPYDRAWRSDELLSRLAAELRDHLTPNGRARIVLSTDADVPAVLRLFWNRGFRSEVVDRRRFSNETLRLYELTLVHPHRT